MPEATQPDDPRLPYVAFDRAAGFYEDTRSLPPHLRARVAQLVAYQIGDDPRPFLDAGVGTGRFARHLIAELPTVVGVDASLPMMQEALRLCPGLHLVRGDLRYLPLPTGMFAGALIVHVLHLVADWQRVVAEARRVIAPDGVLFLAQEGPNELRTRRLYSDLVAERGWSRAHIGAESIDAAVAHLRELGADVLRIDEDALRWTVRETVADAIAMLRRNPFSHQWHLPAANHDALCDELARRAAEQIGPPDTVDECRADLRVWCARWP